MNRFLPLLVALVPACLDFAGGEDPSDWFVDGEALDVEEEVWFTRRPYDFPAEGEYGIGDLVSERFAYSWGTRLAPDDVPEDAVCSNWEPDYSLPVEIEGVVTIHPRFYFKTDGCTSDDEKYYGSFFVQDATGGVFVLGDSKVAHFDVGDRVRLKVRGIRRSFGFNMVYVHDVLEVERLGDLVYYEMAESPLGDRDVGEVRRTTGKVLTEKDTFGLFWIDPDGTEDGCTAAQVADTNHDGEADCVGNHNCRCIAVQLDTELNRRGIDWPVGSHITATGPVLFSYDIYSLVIMNVGQVTRTDL